MARSITRGPWTKALLPTGEVHIVAMHASFGRRLIAVVNRPDGAHLNHKQREQIQNAHADLIGCAPALLTAAEAVLKNWEGGDLAAAVRELADAVSKAKGGGQ